MTESGVRRRRTRSLRSGAVGRDGGVRASILASRSRLLRLANLSLLGAFLAIPAVLVVLHVPATLAAGAPSSRAPGVSTELNRSGTRAPLSPASASTPNRAMQTGISQTPSATKPHWACPQGPCDAIVEPRPVKRSRRWALSAASPLLEGSGELGGYSPSDLRSAYQIPATGGSQHTIALVDAYGYPNAEADLAQYRERYGLGPCTTANGCFRKTNQNGEEANYPTSNGRWEGESALDLDMASAACQSCHIILVEASSAAVSDMAAAENTAAGLGATEISNSYGIAEEGCPLESNCEELSSAYDHPGIFITASAGDSGYDNYLAGAESPSFPASSPYVVAVGGTSLKKAANSRGWSEEVWEEPALRVGTGSGCSGSEPKPVWQSDTGCLYRSGNDVAAVAACNSPVSVYSSANGGWSDFCGTSASAPLLAGIEAHASSYAHRLPGADAFYQDLGGLFDVTLGSNEGVRGECVPPEETEYLCHARSGYDGPTGNGTPSGPLGVETAPPTAVTSPASSAGGTAATLNGVIDPQGLETNYHFEYGTSTAYGTDAPAADAAAGSGLGSTSVSQTITGLQPNTTYHYRIYASNSGGAAHGQDASFTTAPATVAGVQPNSGPSDGGNPVTITGANFAGVTSVRFGSVKAKSYVVNSDTSITATAPAGHGSVDVVVTTAAGTSATSSADRFGYVIGPVLAWGFNGGRLGNGAATLLSTLPVEMLGVPDAAGLAAGSGQSLALLGDGSVLASGPNEVGEVGDGTQARRYAPVKVCAPSTNTCPHGPYLEEVASVAAGAHHSLALLKDGTVVAWGDNFQGQLGIGVQTHFTTVPTRVCLVAEFPCKPENYLREVAAIAAGGFHSLALLKNGTVMTWGFDQQGQLGVGTTTGPDKCNEGFEPCSTVPVAVTGVSEVTAVAAGTNQSLALLRNGTVLAWGENLYGNLGDGTIENRDSPVAVCAAGETAPCAHRLENVTAIAEGWQYGLALLNDGTVKAWGENFEGELGDGTNSGPELCSAESPCSRTPVAVLGLSGVSAIAAGETSSGNLAVLSDGEILAWGGDVYGILGSGTFNGGASTPQHVCAAGSSGPCPNGPYLAGTVQAMSVGGDHDLISIHRAPSVVAEPASSVTISSAVLHGIVNPNGKSVSDCHFEYGLSPSYGESVPCSSLPGAGEEPVAVSASLGGLSGGRVYHFRVVATSSSGTADGSDRTFETLPPPRITTSGLTEGRVDSRYSQTLTAAGGTLPYSWSVSSGSLPAGLHLNAQSGAIAGTPSAQGTSSFTVEVTDSSSPTASATANLSITINAAAEQAAEFGQCVAQKKGEYTERNCLSRSAKAHKGSFEWRPGPAATCVAQKKGEYTTSACTTRSSKPRKGHFEKQPGPGYTAVTGAVSLETPGLPDSKLACSASTAAGEITGVTTGLERITFTGCEAGGVECQSTGPNGVASGQAGVVVTNTLATRLLEPVAGRVWIQYLSAEHAPYRFEIECGSRRFRAIGSLAGVQAGNVNVSTRTSTTTFSLSDGEQALFTELSETGGATWAGPDESSEVVVATNTAASESEIRT